MKPMKKKAFLKMMKADGWVFERQGGEHEYYKHDGLGKSFAVPRHCPISPGVQRNYKMAMEGK